jgi:hypothetical protein
MTFRAKGKTTTVVSNGRDAFDVYVEFTEGLFHKERFVIRFEGRSAREFEKEVGPFPLGVKHQSKRVTLIIE